MAGTGALERGRENATEIVSSFVTGTWILALVAGFDWWLWFMLFGYMVLIPTVERLFGEAGGEWQEDDEWQDDDEWRENEDREAGGERKGDEGWRGRPGARWGDAHTGDETESGATPERNNKDALETLRDRYARGELTDEQFERKVERLLEIETLEDVEDRARESASGADAEADETNRETNR